MNRPKLGEDEDELLKFQQEYLSSSNKPSATVFKKSEKRKSASGATHGDRDVVHMDTLPAVPPTLHPQPPKKSRFRAERDKVVMHSEPTTIPAPQAKADDGPPLDPEEMLERHDRGLASVISSIIERDTRNATFTMPRQSSQAFPSVIRTSNFKMSGGQRQSLFTQQVAQQGVQDFGVVVQQEADKMDISDATTSNGSASSGQGSNLPQAHSKSHIVDGCGLSVSQAEEEARSIHQENMVKMSEMAEEEIMAEQQRLLEMLDPSLVEFLKSKCKSEKLSAGPSKGKSSQKHVKLVQTTHSTQSGDIADVPEAAELTSRKDWVHMDKVEYDKLEWMKDLPPPSADDAKTGQQARFDFQGNVMPVDADIPVQSGLHHHGEEPERAGYSIGELFQLARSTNIQQRVLALTTLGRVMHKAKEGLLDELIQTPIIPSILDAGVIFLLRWACDDSVDSIVVAAVSALSALLCNPADEAALDTVSPWYHGQAVPALIPPATLQLIAKNKMEEDEDNKVEEDDAEVAKRDLIQGLISRMMLQERLFFILDTRRPQAPTVVAILNILTRVARHSAEMAYEIARNTKLMNLIFHYFLPTNWDTEASGQKAVSSVYGRPLAAAMRLMGSLCQAGRHMASSLVSTYSLQNILMGYLAVSADDLLLSEWEAESLQKESLITWRILLSYGLAADVFLKIYKQVIDHLKGMLRLSDLIQHQPSARDVYFMSVLEGVLPVAAIPSVKPDFSHGEGTHAETSVTSCVDWSQVEGLFPLVTLCAEQCLTQLAQHYTQQKPSLQFPAVCVNFLATYHSKWSGQSSKNAVDYVQQVEKFCSNSLTPFLKSWGFTSILAKLCASSNVLSPCELKRREVTSCLPELGCDGCEQRVPVVGCSSPVGFLLALTRLMHTLCRLHKDVTEQTARALLSHEDVRGYLFKVTACPINHLHGNHFTRMETLLHYYLIKLSTLLMAKHRPAMMHQLALDVMLRLQEGDEFLAQDLMTTALFNADFFPEGQEEELTAASVADMKISDTNILKSATQEEITTNNCQLLREGFRSLHVIRSHYFKAFAQMEGKVAKSRCCCQQMPQGMETLMVGGWESSLMPRDWVFLPLVELYNRFANVQSWSKKAMEVSSIPMVTSVVQWIFLLEMWRSRSLSHVSVTLKVSRVMCVFLTGDELFLDKTAYPYLASLFRIYTMPHLLNTMNFEEHVPGISSFYDLYMLFLDQYEAVSFGDPVFSAFVLLPMQQCQSCLLRRAVWQERSLLLRSMMVPVKEMLINIDRYLNPDETDLQLLQLYAGCLLSGSVRQCWSPVLFVVAVHHLNRFLFYTQDANSDLRRSLWDKILQCQDKSLRELIINFKQVNTQEADCIEVFTQLPASRQTVVSQHAQRLGLYL